MTYSQVGGSGSDRLTAPRRRCISSNVPGSPVRASACASARASIRRDTNACAGPPASPATVATARRSPIARGSPMDVTPASRSSPVHDPSINSTITPAAVPSAPISVPLSTSLSLAWPSSCATTEITSAGVALASIVS